MLAVMAMLFSAPVAKGQDLGKILGQVAGTTSVANPLAQFIEVEPIGLFAVSESETNNNAYLVLRVLNFTEQESVLFGSGVQNKKMLAVDPFGNVLNIDASGGYRLDVPSDIPVKVVLDEPALQFMNVRQGTNVMPLVKIGINIDAKRQGNLTFKNVPVYWDQVP